MNAAEARALSLKNSIKAADELEKASILAVEMLINQAAKKGKTTARFQLSMTEPSFTHDFVEKISAYFMEKGFKVETRNFFLSVVFFISW
jgi:hypothetical protein